MAERISREPTQLFPSNRRVEWIQRERVAPHVTEGGRWVEFEYELYSDFDTLSKADRPFLIVNHKAQFREDHQRIIQGPNGGLMHVSGVEVMPEDMETFMASSQEAFELQPNGTWRRRRAGSGRTLSPFMFRSAPWCGGQLEPLDPQWQRETFTIPIADQVQECIRRRLDRAELRREFGDKRGTTLNLQIGASADDAQQATSDSVNIDGLNFVSDDPAEHVGLRFQGVTIPQGATIDDAILRIRISGSLNDEPIHQVRGHANDNAAAFQENNNDIDGRTRTTATVQWNSTDIGSASNEFQAWGCTTDNGAGATIETIIQEIVDRAGWSSGNALALIYEQHSSDANRDLGIDFYDLTSAAGATLDIDYTVAVPAAAITGTAAAGIDETDVVAGGETIIITLTNDTWVASGGTFDAIRQDIIDGLDSAQSEATGWNNDVRDNEVTTAVVRTSDTVVTITLSAAASYDITATETITVTVPATAVTGGGAITATPTFTVTKVGGVPVVVGLHRIMRDSNPTYAGMDGGLH